MKLPISLLISLMLLTACLANKKPTQAEQAKEAADYDYRQALQNFQLGINYIHSKEIHEAISHLEQAVDADQSNFRYLHGLGLAYSLNGQMEEAEVKLKECLKINPSFSEANNVLGSIYCDLGRYDEAIVCLKQVIQDKTYSQPQFAYFNLGKLKRLQLKNEEAIAAFQLATQLDPKFYRANIALGEIYRERKDYRNMLNYYQRAEPNYPNDVNVLFQIGYALFKLKQYDRAKTYLAQVSILFPPADIDRNTQDMMVIIENIIRNQRN